MTSRATEVKPWPTERLQLLGSRQCPIPGAQKMLSEPSQLAETRAAKAIAMMAVKRMLMELVGWWLVVGCLEGRLKRWMEKADCDRAERVIEK